MDEKHLKIIIRVYDLVQRQNTALGLAVSTIQDTIQCLKPGQRPSREQLNAWKTKNRQLRQQLLALDQALESLSEVVVPLMQGNIQWS